MSAVEKIRGVIFDWGGVLAEDPAPGMVKYCAKALAVSEDQYKQACKLFMDDFQTGRVTEREFWQSMTKRLNVPMPKVNSLWADALAAVYVPRKDMFSLADRLHKAGYKTAILSNTEKPVVDFFPEQTYDAFDVVVRSCLEGISKPQREIYEITLARLGTPAKQTLFIDDRQDFIDGAKRVGLQTIQFKGLDQFKKDLANTFGRIDNGFFNVT